MAAVMVRWRVCIVFLLAGACSSDPMPASTTGAPPTSEHHTSSILEKLLLDIDTVSAEIPQILTLQKAAIKEYRSATSATAAEAALKTQEDLNRRMTVVLDRLEALRDKAKSEAAAISASSGEQPN